MLTGATSHQKLAKKLAALEQRAWKEIEAESVATQSINIRRELDVRYQGQSYELTVPLSSDYEAEFHRAHFRAYGHSDTDAPLEIVNLRLNAVGALKPPSLPRAEPGSADAATALNERRPVVLSAGIVETPFYTGEALQPGQMVTGPAVISHADTTVLLPDGDSARVDPWCNLVLEIALPEHDRTC